MAIIALAWQFSLGARRENAWYQFYTVWSFRCACIRAQQWRTRDAMNRWAFSGSVEWVGTYVFNSVSATLCAPMCIQSMFALWSGQICVYMCPGSDEKPLECEPDVVEHRYPPTPTPTIPWDRNKEARLHQAGLWSALLYRVPISNWQPSDPACFLCNVHTWKFWMYYISYGHCISCTQQAVARNVSTWL